MDCVICEESLFNSKRIKQTDCGHLFHEICIDNALKKGYIFYTIIILFIFYSAYFLWYSCPFLFWYFSTIDCPLCARRLLIHNFSKPYTKQLTGDLNKLTSDLNDQCGANGLLDADKSKTSRCSSSEENNSIKRPQKWIKRVPNVHLKLNSYNGTSDSSPNNIAHEPLVAVPTDKKNDRRAERPIRNVGSIVRLSYGTIKCRICKKKCMWIISLLNSTMET